MIGSRAAWMTAGLALLTAGLWQCGLLDRVRAKLSNSASDLARSDFSCLAVAGGLAVEPLLPQVYDPALEKDALSGLPQLWTHMPAAQALVRAAGANLDAFLDRLEDSGAELPKVHFSNRTTFTYYNRDRSAPLADPLQWRPDYNTADLPMKQFRRCLLEPCGRQCAVKPGRQPEGDKPSQAATCPNLYFSSDVDHGRFQALRPSFPATDAHVLRLLTEQHQDLSAHDLTPLRQAARKKLQRRQQRFLWIGSANVTTNFHVDDAHNLYVQLHGVKRFYLLPPSAFDRMQVFPLAHPHDRQSQIPWSPSGDKQDSLSLHTQLLSRQDTDQHQHQHQQQQPTVLCATLLPGDALLLPAGWFHHVEAITASVSLNHWVQSEGSMLLSELFHNALPFATKDWELDRRRLAVQNFVPLVVTKVVCGTLSAERESRSVDHDCDKELWRIDESAGSAQQCAKRAQSTLHRTLVSTYTPALRESLRQAHGQDRPSCSQSRGRGLQEFLAPYVEDVSRTFLAMRSCERYIYLGTWVQALLSLVADAAQLPGFAERCLTWPEDAR